MSSPFPGANPYLEQPDYWSDFHNQLVAEIARTLIPQVLPNYRVAKYEAKRQTILGSKTHLIEIDLLRAGQPLTVEGEPFQSHYRILVSRSQQRPMADLYPFNLSEPIPSFPVPLHPGEPEPIIPLQDLVDGLYEQLGYAYFIDYEQEPPPPWTGDEVVPFLGNPSPQRIMTDEASQ